MLPLLLDGDQRKIRVVTTYSHGNVIYVDIQWAETEEQLQEMRDMAETLEILMKIKRATS